MASIDKLKGRYLFGGSEAASIVPQAGNPGGNLTYLAGPGGAIWHPNYVELKQGSRFRAPFNSVPRNRTIILIGLHPFYEWVYDTGDSTNKWPVTVAPFAPMKLSEVLASWPEGGYITNSGAALALSLAGGSQSPVHHYTVGYDTPMSYRDASYNFRPQVIVVGQGADGTGTYSGLTTQGKRMAWATNDAAYTGSGARNGPTHFGNCTYSAGAGTTPTAHCILLAYAEYEYLTKAEVVEAVTELVTLLEARGWVNTFHNPMKIKPSTEPAGVGELVPPSNPQPGIVAASADFTVDDSPVPGWKRITKVGGANGTLERAAYSSAALARHWSFNIRDVSGQAVFLAGTTIAAGPNGPANISGWYVGTSGNANFLVYNNGAYAGAYKPRVAGQSYSQSRATPDNGYVKSFIGDDKYLASANVSAHYSMGQTDADVPVIFDCAIAGIGQYIDVRIS